MATQGITVPEVAVLVETDDSWGRSVVRGVVSYAQKFGPWNLIIEPRDRAQDRVPEAVWRAGGVIARINTPLFLQQLQASGLPVVDLDEIFLGAAGIDSVLTDERQRSRLALDHFRAKGFQNFACYAPPSRDYAKARGRAFVEAVADAGGACQQYRPGYRVGRQISREEHRHRVGRWLSQLPLPVAVFAVDAARGKDLVEIGLAEGFQIPDQIAVLAAVTDELACEVCVPPLSSITIAGRTIGYEAAARLHARLGGAPVAASPARVAPLGVLSRQSTDILAIDDPQIVRALRFMQTHACSGITVEDVLEAVPMSRRQFERQFKRRLGRLPAEELRRLRLERGRELLAETDMSVDEIAEACGYAGATQFGSAFRKRYDATPLAFRKRLG